MLDLLRESLGASWLLSLLAAYAGGVLASLTPCVYPLIPITASYVASQTENASSRRRAPALSAVYVLGLATTYALLGFTAAFTGSFFGAIATNPWTLLLVGVFISMFSLAMMDVFAVPIPRVFSAIGGKSSAARGLPGAFLLGLASGLVAGPCTAPVLAVLLAYVAAEGAPVFGFSVLFVFSFGMGTLLIVVGTFAGAAARLPKSGSWMVFMKKALGLAMLAAGEYFVFQAGVQWL